MMKKFVLLALASVVSFTLAADELPDAPKDELVEILRTCNEWAVEDEIAEDKLKPYLLECVNEQLESLGFKKIDNIDDIKKPQQLR